MKLGSPLPPRASRKNLIFILNTPLKYPLKIMAKIIGAVDINRERCKGCDLCVVACPCGVLTSIRKNALAVPPVPQCVPTAVLPSIVQ